MKTYIVDTYAWISYFEERKAFKEEIEQNYLETPSIALAELTRVMKKKKVSTEQARKVLNYVIENSLILELGIKNAIMAGEVAEREKLHLIDAIIYSYCNEEKQLLTGDLHFKNKRNAKLI